MYRYVTQTKVLCKELFYQLVIRGFGEFSTITLQPPPPLYELALAGLDRPGSNWTEEDGPKEALVSF
jgi:DNA mismatch repair protein MLH1